MNNRSRRVLHVVAGIYLIYLSFNLISQQLKEATSNATVAWIAAIAFGVFGIFIIIRYIMNSIKDFHEQENEIEEKADEE